MGLDQSKPLQRSKSFARSASSLSEKNLQPEITTFASELASLVCLETTVDAFDYQIFRKLPFKEHYAPLPFCNKVSKNQSSIFVCYDCSINEQAFFCESCFQKGEHDSHRFSVFTDNAGYSETFCRCGDPNFMKKKIICKDHKEAGKVGLVVLDKKQASKFNAYFSVIFSILSTSQTRSTSNLLFSMMGYLFKLTENNLYYSKMFLQFLLASNQQNSNLSFLLKSAARNVSELFRNLNFINEYNKPLLIEVIKILNEGAPVSRQYEQLVINFAGSIDVLNQLARESNITVESSNFFRVLQKLQVQTTDIWKCAVKKGLVSKLVGDDKTMKTLLGKLKGERQFIVLIFKQLLSLSGNNNLPKYILASLMIIAPEMFILKSKPKISFDKELEGLLLEYYKKILNSMATHQKGNRIQCDLLLLLPYFTFGEKLLTKFWEEFERRIIILEGFKERDCIRNGSWNYLDVVSSIAKAFVVWEHTVMKRANQFGLQNYTKEKDLIKRLLIQNFEKRQKILRNEVLEIVDSYTQKKRDLSKEVIQKQLRYNPLKQKYYYVGKVLPNNLFNYLQFRVDSELPLTEWQLFVAPHFFDAKLCQIMIKLIATAQRALKDDLQMVSTVSNLTIFLSLVNRKQKPQLKAATRNFVKEIPDVQQSTYYLLADIRNRLELDIEDLQEEGMKGKKKRKMDIIAEIRDKKFQEIREKQKRNRQKWLKMAEKGFASDISKEVNEEICYVCKEKEGKNSRFVIPCFFTRNSVVSTLLQSEVTDLDINVCLHQMHEECFNKLKKRNECPVCKFQANCILPLKPLVEESYIKNWLRKFEEITTRINLQSGKNFSSDWATIFLTYMVYTRSFKILLDSSERQQRERNRVDELIMMHYRSQLDKWPELTKKAIDKAQKTVKGQIRRESNTKKVVKSLVLDLILQELTHDPFKNEKRIHKKFRQLITAIGKQNAQKISDCFGWARDNEGVEKTFDEGVMDEGEDHKLFKMKQLPATAMDFIRQTSIKCPMCDKYQPKAWKCLFCDKISCENCIRVRQHCEFDHRGNVIVLHLNNAQFELWADNRTIEGGSLYQNEYLQGWRRSMKPQGWKANIDQIYTFFDKILHSESVENRKADDDDSEDGRNNNQRWQDQDEGDEEDE